MCVHTPFQKPWSHLAVCPYPSLRAVEPSGGTRHRAAILPNPSLPHVRDYPLDPSAQMLASDHGATGLWLDPFPRRPTSRLKGAQFAPEGPCPSLQQPISTSGCG